MIGSRDDLIKQNFSTNKYFVLRHGEAISNVEKFISGYPEPRENSLSEKGKFQVKKLAKELGNKKIDMIISSDIKRTQKTAEIIGKALGIKPLFDKRLREIDFGLLNGETIKVAKKYFNSDAKLSKKEIRKSKWYKGFPEGESYSETLVRTLDFIKEIDKKYKNKNILIVSHEILLSMIETSSKGYTSDEILDFRKELAIQTAEIRKIDYKK